MPEATFLQSSTAASVAAGHRTMHGANPGPDLDSIYVVIAAFNEQQVIAKTIAEVASYVTNIVVVDDCSSDSTWRAARDAGAHVLRHPINLGQGGALQTGIDYALLRGADYIVTFDADGQHAAADIMPIVAALKQQRVEVALGSRFLGGVRNLPRRRRLVLRLAILFTRLTGGGRYTDVHNGFRAMSRRFCEGFRFDQNRMAHASEILKYIAAKRVPYIEFPTTVTYSEYSLAKGQTNANALRIILELILKRLSK
jgi:polyprenyl-phospho-N-acetylgalactosaminyl synthase